MVLDPATLLAGPRGRRLCLEFALRHGESNPETQPLAHAVSAAKYYLGNGAVGYSTGRFRSLLRRISFRLPYRLGICEPAPAEPFVVPEPNGVAELLATLPLTEPDTLSLLHALCETVDSARYWQEPEPLDILATAPDVTLALERVAAVIAASLPVANWGRPAPDAQQWAVVFMEEGPTRPHPSLPATPKTAAENLVEWREGVRSAETRATDIRSTSPESAHSGEWWSTPPAWLTSTTGTYSNDQAPDLGESAGRGPAGLWLVEDGRGWERATVMRVITPHGARIFTIDGPDAWVQLCRLFPLEVTASRRHDWFATTGRDGRWVTPDWVAARQEYDAVHLTIAGYLHTAGRALALDAEWACVLAGWSPDRTFWLRDVAADPLTAEDWLFDPAERRWVRASDATKT